LGRGGDCKGTEAQANRGRKVGEKRTRSGSSRQESYIKQLLDEVEHDIMNYQNRGLYYLPKPKAEADNTDKRF